MTFECDNPFHSAQQQFDNVAELLDLPQYIRAVLRVPQREFSVNFPVHMNDGTTSVYTGYRVQHNLSRSAREGHLTRRDQDTLRVIAAQAKRLHTLIDSVLDLARLHNGQTQIAKQVFDLAALARQAVANARLTAAQHLRKFRDPDGPVLIVGDSVRLEQVLQNLLDNAVKYSPADRVITVCVEQPNAEAILTISDHGIDIPEAARAQLFERFYRAGNLDPRRVRGTGIGLSIVSEIVALHGGVVEVDSAEGHGSTFTVRLPLPQERISAQSAQAINPRESVPPAMPTHTMERPATEHYQEHIY